ncbi:uncharacterized protein LOC124896600 [Capsicum annuum]|uniref:uncharacterized protein LOC124896600 n=1 Tax=Capsicum annuum TaxID=4072 RepID=UPI001FB160BC|nr:uncharacterized protein LOC124896600 [Capsicum annuum]
MKDLETAKKILRMEIRRDREANRLFLTQKKYLEKVLERFRMKEAKPVSTLAAHFKLSTTQLPQSKKEERYFTSSKCGKSIYGLSWKSTLTGGEMDSKILACWKATSQHVVALSTTQEEYMAVTEAIKEALWLKASQDFETDLNCNRDLTESPKRTSTMSSVGSVGIVNTVVCIEFNENGREFVNSKGSGKLMLLE